MNATNRRSLLADGQTDGQTGGKTNENTAKYRLSRPKNTKLHSLPTFVFFGGEDHFITGFDVPAVEFAVRRAGEQILGVGREGGFEGLTSGIGMTSERVRHVTLEGVDESNGRSVGEDEDGPTVRRELESRPVGLAVRRRCGRRRVHVEIAERPFVVGTQVVEFDALGVYASSEDQAFRIEGGHLYFCGERDDEEEYGLREAPSRERLRTTEKRSRTSVYQEN